METRFCYHAQNYAEVRHFYENELKWSIYKEWDRSATDKGVVYHAGSALLEILLAPVGQATKFNNDFYLYLETEDLKSLHEKLASATPIKSYSWGHSSFTIKDPAGLPIKFFMQEAAV